MTEHEGELILREVHKLEQRVVALETRGADLLDKDDLLRLRDAIDALERSVLDVMRWERDSTVQPIQAPKFSMSPARKIRLKVWEWVALAFAAAASGAAATLAQSCT